MRYEHWHCIQPQEMQLLIKRGEDEGEEEREEEQKKRGGEAEGGEEYGEDYGRRRNGRGRS